jgi:hypothetical protein
MPEGIGLSLTVMKFLLDMALRPTLEAEPEWVAGTGQYQLSSTLAETESCKRAEQRAKFSALQKLGGERITGESLLTCTDNGEVNCPITEFTWSTFDGLIKGIKDKTVEKINGACVVTLQAYVDTGTGKTDPNFDLTVRLSNKVFEPYENMTIKINATEPMYVHVFNWNPYTVADNQVTRLFPNVYDTDNYVDTKLVIPKAEYNLKVVPESAARQSTEYLQVVATKEQVKFLDTYSLYEFRNKILDIPKSQRKYVRKPYMIMRQK